MSSVLRYFPAHIGWQERSECMVIPAIKIKMKEGININSLEIPSSQRYEAGGCPDNGLITMRCLTMECSSL